MHSLRVMESGSGNVAEVGSFHVARVFWMACCERASHYFAIATCVIRFFVILVFDCSVSSMQLQKLGITMSPDSYSMVSWLSLSAKVV